MRVMKTCRVILILYVFAALGMANEEDFSRYQLIIDKQPFGQEPPEMDTTQVAVSESFARNLRLSMLFEAADGTTRAGIIDNSTMKNYILSLGEAQDGLEMIEADIRSSEAMIRKGQEVALFKLEAAGGQPVSRAEQVSRQSSYSERRRLQMQRLEERSRNGEQAPEQRLTGEALKKHLEEVQMDAIRNGLPPLPMQLTPEMDAQLVAEGVLPPQDTKVSY